MILKMTLWEGHVDLRLGIDTIAASLYESEQATRRVYIKKLRK